ncbi:MAG TPA: phosphate starvation-inducible protein PhoH, partial [Magnetovibrio sp.]
MSDQQKPKAPAKAKAKTKPKTIKTAKADPAPSASLAFADNAVAQALYGPHSAHLVQIETGLDVTITARGANVAVEGTADAVETAERVLLTLYERLKRGAEVGTNEVDAALR